MIKIFKSGSEEWLEARQQYITGTEVASLFGLNPNKSINKVMEGKSVHDKVIDNKYMRAGRGLEPSVIVWTSELGLPCRPASTEGVVMHTDEENRISSTMDAIITIKDRDYYMEIKTTSPDNYDKWEDKFPDYYLLQVQSQILVSDSNTAVVAYTKTEMPFPIRLLKVDRNDIILDLIKKETARFWKCFDIGNKFVVNKTYKERMVELLKKTWKKIY